MSTAGTGQGLGVLGEGPPLLRLSAPERMCSNARRLGWSALVGPGDGHIERRPLESDDTSAKPASPAPQHRRQLHDGRLRLPAHDGRDIGRSLGEDQRQVYAQDPARVTQEALKQEPALLTQRRRTPLPGERLVKLPQLLFRAVCRGHRRRPQKSGCVRRWPARSGPRPQSWILRRARSGRPCSW